MSGEYIGSSIHSDDENKQANILMIEDDYQDVAIFQGLLSQQKYSLESITHAQSVSEGLACLQSAPCDTEIVVLDLSLPDAWGLEGYYRIHAQYPTVPIIIHSGNLDETVAIEAVQRGAQDYLIKGSFNSHLLNRTICYALERHRQLAELQREKRKLQELSVKLRESNQRLAIANQELGQLAVIDELTQLHNRRHFDEVLRTEWYRLARESAPLSLILCDIDYFKDYNDTYGHLAGDRCLQQVASALATAVQRPADFVARYGGEEFALILPNTDLKGATHIAHKVQAAIQQLSLDHPTSSVSDQVTLSIGVASMVPDSGVAIDQLLDAADRALYAAKRRGRNQMQITLPDLVHAISKVRQASHKARAFSQVLHQTGFGLPPAADSQRNTETAMF